MKIALVAGHFMPEIGYQEVYLARAFSSLGHKVTVFTTTAISPTSNKIINYDYKPGTYSDEKYKYEVIRYKPDFQFRTIVYFSKLNKEIEKHKYDLVLILGVGKLFPISLIKNKIDARYISIFGDAKEYRNRKGVINKIKSILLDIGFYLIKKKYYEKCIEVSDFIIMNVPETEDFFYRILSNKYIERFNKIKYPLNLGYDLNEFYYDEKKRKKVRQKLIIEDDSILFICHTKVNRIKNIEMVILSILKLLENGYKVHFVLSGLLGDDYEEELRELINNSLFANKFHLFGFVSHEESRDLFCASDVGIWTKAAITIQEAMGTGLKVLIPDRRSVSHLLNEGINGWYYEEGELYRKMEFILNHTSNEGRNGIALSNSQYLSYNSIAGKILTLLPIN